MVQQLLTAGADPDTRQTGGQTALMAAARSGCSRRWRPCRRADLDAREDRGQTAMMWAAAHGHAEVVSWLVAQAHSPAPAGVLPHLPPFARARWMWCGCRLRRVWMSPRPCHSKRNGCSVPRGMTSLMAVENGHFEIAIALVEAGARPNDTSAGYAALHAISWVRKPDHEGVNGMPPPDTTGGLSSLDCTPALGRCRREPSSS